MAPKYVVLEHEKLMEAFQRILEKDAGACRRALVPRELDFRDVVTELCGAQGLEVEFGPARHGPVTVQVDRRLVPNDGKPILAFEELGHELFDTCWIGRGVTRQFFANRYHDNGTAKTPAETNAVMECSLPACHMKRVTAISFDVAGDLSAPATVSFHYAFNEEPIVSFELVPGERGEILGQKTLSLSGEETILDFLEIGALEAFHVQVTGATETVLARVTLHGSLFRPVRNGEKALPFEPVLAEPGT